MPYSASSPLLQELIAAGVVRMNNDNNGLLLPNGQALSMAALSGKAVVNNNAAAGYTVGDGINYVGFTGTQAASVAFTFPAGLAANDGVRITIFTQAAVGTAATWISAGATFVGAPATLAALSRTSFIYNHATLQWLPA